MTAEDEADHSTTDTPASSLEERWRTAVADCERTVVGHVRRTPAETLASWADACDELGIEQWDTYGAGGAVERLETEVADLLGTPAAAFVISGTMGQQAALRVWTERRGSDRVALPDLSHLVRYEDDGARLLHGFRFEELTRGRRTPTAADLTSLPGADRLGALLVELPLRDAGCLLPTWEELTALSEAARELAVPLHVDGARLWESAPFYERPLTEIVGLVDSVYVSFYKGLAGAAGAAIAGDEDLVAEVRLWRHRMGGTLYRMTPYALGALVGLREQLPRMEEYAAWARAFAAALVVRGFRVLPDPPQTNTFQVLADGQASEDAVNERLLAHMVAERIQISGMWWDSTVPGVVTTELAVAAAALEHDPEVVADTWARTVLAP